MNKQSSVQWLFQKLWDTPKDKFEWQSIFLMAYEMHKKEVIETARYYFHERGKLTPGQLYNKTFNK